MGRSTGQELMWGPRPTCREVLGQRPKDVVAGGGGLWSHPTPASGPEHEGHFCGHEVAR